MTRTKEPKIGSTDVPEYKSPLPRIVRSLRKGYDNLRKKVDEHSKTIMELRGKLRDTQKSREDWKIKTQKALSELDSLQKKNAELESHLSKKKSPKSIKN
jgi:chromosome segregation ATPase